MQNGKSQKSDKQVYYQEYAQTAACGCVGCGAGKPVRGAPCITMDGTDGPGSILDGCKPKAVLATPYVQEMRRSCSWGYAYPFDDSQGGLTCTGAKTLTMTVSDVNGAPGSGGDGGDESGSWIEVVLYVVVAVLLLGIIGLNFWHGFVAWPACLMLVSVYAGCLALAWLVWKGVI